MWVVKLGGSLARDALLPQWLTMLAELGAGRIVIVPGGGRFADAGREAQAWWKLDDVAGHNIAVLGMCQYAHVLAGLCPSLRRVSETSELAATVGRGEVAVWQPLELLREAPDALTTWDVTADSLALWLAARLDAERVVLVKRCAIPAGADWTTLAALEIVDRRFPEWASRARHPIELVNGGDLEVMRTKLLGCS